MCSCSDFYIYNKSILIEDCDSTQNSVLIGWQNVRRDHWFLCSAYGTFVFCYADAPSHAILYGPWYIRILVRYQHLGLWRLEHFTTVLCTGALCALIHSFFGSLALTAMLFRYRYYRYLVLAHSGIPGFCVLHIDTLVLWYSSTSVILYSWHTWQQCCGSEIINFGSGSYFDLNSRFGSGLFLKNIFKCRSSKHRKKNQKK
jgi:hypothetical protein